MLLDSSFSALTICNYTCTTRCKQAYFGVGDLKELFLMFLENLCKYRSKGCKNVHHENKDRCRDGAVLIYKAWQNQLVENPLEQGRGSVLAQPRSARGLSMQQFRSTFTDFEYAPSQHLATICHASLYIQY